MKRLVDVLTPAETAELQRTLPVGSPNSADSRAVATRVREIVDKDLLIADDSVATWGGIEPLRRLRMISEMIWRITCVNDGSATAVEGLTKFNLGYNFSLARAKESGRDVFVVQS